MKRASLLPTFLLVAVSHAVVLADVTITMTNSIDGPMAGLVGANGSSMTMRVQGLKARTDMEIMGRTLATVMDVADKQIFMLDQTEKTVRRMPLTSPNQANATAGGGLNVVMPKMDVAVERTGRTEQIAGQECVEFHTTMTMDLSQAGGALANPDARDAIKDMRLVMKGSTWISTASPAASEFLKFQQEAKAAGLVMPTDLFNGQSAGVPIGQPTAGTEGLPCLSEIEMNYEGTGSMIDMLRKMGTMKVTSRLTGISLAPIEPEMFVVPAGYTEASTQDPLIPIPRR